MKILFMDDSKTRHAKFRDYIWTDGVAVEDQEVTHCYSKDQAAICMELEKFDVVHLDHDLGGVADEMCLPYGKTRVPNGTALAVWMRDHLPKDKWPTKIIIHSFNSIGAKEMKTIFEKDMGHTDVSYIPFNLSDSDIIKFNTPYEAK